MRPNLSAIMRSSLLKSLAFTPLDGLAVETPLGGSDIHAVRKVRGQFSKLGCAL